MDVAYNRGALACWLGLWKNPYEVESSEFRAWQDGYNEQAALLIKLIQ